MSDPIKCVRCGEEFDTLTERMMHVQRRRCPEIETQADVTSASFTHAVDELRRGCS